MGYFQLNAAEVNNALKEYRVADTFCILAVTNQDLYPREEWNFVFGLADMDSCCGVFSFHRHFEMHQQGLSETEKLTIWMKRSCWTMVHEIGHMFGLRHCIYYECIMNGSNGHFEGDRYPDRTLCPVCLCKLKLNATFDCREQFTRLIETSNSLGF